MSQTDAFIQRVISVYAPTASERGYSEKLWPMQIRCADGAISLLEAQPPAKLLDLACGTGPSTIAIALRGFQVTALDCTPASLDIARRMSSLKGAHVEWLCQDMRAIDYHEEFDYVCLRDVIFGILETREEDLDLIGRMALALKPGGRCFIEAYNREFALQHGIEGVAFHDPTSDRFVSKDPNRRSIALRLYSHDDWRQMLGGHGLRIVRMDGWNWPADPAPPPRRADCIVAEKALKGERR